MSIPPEILCSILSSALCWFKDPVPKLTLQRKAVTRSGCLLAHFCSSPVKQSKTTKNHHSISLFLKPKHAKICYSINRNIIHFTRSPAAKCYEHPRPQSPWLQIQEAKLKTKTEKQSVQQPPVIKLQRLEHPSLPESNYYRD